MYQVLASQDECEVAKEMPSQGKDVVGSEMVIKKLRISKRICLVLKRSVDKGNLFVLEEELIPFLLRGICLEALQTKIDFNFLI